MLDHPVKQRRAVAALLDRLEDGFGAGALDLYARERHRRACERVDLFFRGGVFFSGPMASETRHRPATSKMAKKGVYTIAPMVRAGRSADRLFKAADRTAFGRRGPCGRPRPPQHPFPCRPGKGAWQRRRTTRRGNSCRWSRMEPALSGLEHRPGRRQEAAPKPVKAFKPAWSGGIPIRHGPETA